MRATTLTQLAKLLSRNKGYVSRLSKQPWFPQRGEDGAWDVDACQRAIDANLAQRGRRKPADAPPPAEALAAKDDQLVLALQGADSTEVQALDAAFRLATRHLANAATRGLLGTHDLQNMTRASEELRRAKDAALDLATRQGTVIARDQALAALGILVGRLQTILNSVENLLATQVEIWRDNPHLHQLPTKDRAHLVREWFAVQARNLYGAEAALAKAALAEAEEDSDA